MRRFVIILTLLFALFAFINAINAATHEDDSPHVPAVGAGFQINPTGIE
jgi:hypothetical protein